jgi:hypothetical protein
MPARRIAIDILFLIPKTEKMKDIFKVTGNRQRETEIEYHPVSDG